MHIPYLIVRNDDNLIFGTTHLPDPDAGPVRPALNSAPGCSLVRDEVGFSRVGRSAEEMAYLIDGQVEWRLQEPLANIIDRYIAQTYEDVDMIYALAVGNRTVEYQKAEAAARAYMAADVKPSPASIYITCHALSNPTGQVQSEEWAARQIIERADAFSWAVAQLRDARALHQGLMRASASIQELESAKQDWCDFLLWMRAVLGLPPPATV